MYVCLCVCVYLLFVCRIVPNRKMCALVFVVVVADSFSLLLKFFIY